MLIIKLLLGFIIVILTIYLIVKFVRQKKITDLVVGVALPLLMFLFPLLPNSTNLVNPSDLESGTSIQGTISPSLSLDIESDSSTPAAQNPLSTHEDTPTQKHGSIEEKLVGTWSGSYETDSGKKKLDLFITNYNDSIITAVFSFSSFEDDSFPSGSYSMLGTISDDYKIELKGEQWIDRPNGYFFLDINGILSIDDMTIIDNTSSVQIRKESAEISSTPLVKPEISNEGYLTALTPYRMDGVNGYMINNKFTTLRGNGYINGYVATSGNISYDQVISVCSYAPFDLLYNLESKYDTLAGKVGFDDITVSSTDIVGVGSLFQGKSTITFLSGEIVLERVDLSTSNLPTDFNFSVTGVEQLIIRIEFPYTNFVLENFNKYFNFIEVELR